MRLRLQHNMMSALHDACLLKPKVLVRLKLRPVHPADLMAVAGRHIIRPPPFVPGSEVHTALHLSCMPGSSHADCANWRP